MSATPAQRAALARSVRRPRQRGDRFPSVADGWEARLSLSERGQFGMVLTYRQTMALRKRLIELGWEPRDAA